MKRTLLEALALKALPRAGWLRAGVASPESVAAHSWGVAWLTLVLLPEELDLQRALTYAVLHDLAEVRTGDVTPHDGIPASTKAAREHHAMRELMAELPRGGDLLEAWERYEAQIDAEARFVRQLDRLDMALQARAYADAGSTGMAEFLDSAEAVLTDPTLEQLLASLR
ncbi:MAG: HD domain-containing protein [Myxococcales bacterium]|nr:HD domain-containing protein [Myxococcales bacterium]